MGNRNSINLNARDFADWYEYPEVLYNIEQPQQHDSDGEWEDPRSDPTFLDPVLIPQQQRSLPPRSVVRPSPNIYPEAREFPADNGIVPQNVEQTDATIEAPSNDAAVDAPSNDVPVEASSNRFVQEQNSSVNDVVLPTSLLLTLGNEKLRLDFVEKLGEGGYGSVARAVDNRGVSFAVKSLYCHDESTYDEVVFAEVAILFKLDHPNIVKMYGFDVVNSTAILVMEYCSEGTLNKRLDSPIDDMIQLQWMAQLASALSYLHENDIVHRDLKTDNILLSNNSLKVADFGLARHFVCCKEGRMFDNTEYISHYNSRYMETMAGTPFWLAPEVFDHRYNEKADIFSLGVIFHSICERNFCVFNGERYYGVFSMYRGQDTGIGFVMWRRQQWIPPGFHHLQDVKLKEIICDMLAFDPSARVSIPCVRDVLNEVYVTTLNVE